MSDPTHGDVFHGLRRTPLDPPPRPSWLRRNALALGLGGAGLILGAMIGLSAGSAGDSTAQPTPTVTVTEEVVVTEEVEVPAAPVDDGCQAVASELFSMLETMNNSVVLPLAEGGSGGIDAFLNDDIAGVEDSIAKIESANSELIALNGRLEAVGPDYVACVSP